MPEDSYVLVPEMCIDENENVICAVAQIVNCIQKRTVKVENKCFTAHRNTSFLATVYKYYIALRCV